MNNLDISDIADEIADNVKNIHKYYVSEDPRTDFLSHLRALGYQPPRTLKDGVIDRIDTPNDKKGQGSGWYIYYQNADNLASAIGGSWKNDAPEIKWFSKGDNVMTQSERQAFNRQVKQAQERREIAQQKEYDDMAKDAQKKLAALNDATAGNDYLSRKQVTPVEGLKQLYDMLVLPVFVKGEVSSLQYIKPDGTKMFKKGARTKGGYLRINGTDETVYIAEGYATGRSVNMATGATVYVAYSVNNMYEVASALKDLYARVIVAGDNGDACANKCIQIYEGYGIDAIFPPEGYGDFNDLHVDSGLDQVKICFTAQHKIYEPKVESKSTSQEFKFKGALGEMVAYYNATSGNKQPLFAVQTAIGACSVMLARNFTTNYSNKTSMFLMNIGKSTTGKEHGKRVIEQILEATDNAELIAGDGYTSGTAVISALQERPRHVTIIDEFSKYLQAANNKNGSSHLMEANTQLMQAITRLDGTMRAKSYAAIGLTESKKKELANQFVVNPAITMLAMSTPDDLFKNMSIGAIADGFLNRFVICISDAERTIREHKEKIEVPQSIINWAGKIKARYGAQDASAIEAPEDVLLMFTREAVKAQEVFQQYCIDQANALDTFGMAEITGRSNEMAMRMALIIALSEDPNAEKITEDHMGQAIDWIKFNSDRLIKRLKMSISSSDHEADKKEVLGALRAMGNKGMTWSDMQKRNPYSKFKARDLRDILSALVDAELIMSEPFSQGRGRPTTIYKAIK